MAKINISINDDLLKKVDDYADRNYTTRSGTIALALTQLVNQDEILASIKSMSVAMSKIATTGTVDEETQKQLESFQALSNMLINGR